MKGLIVLSALIIMHASAKDVKIRARVCDLMTMVDALSTPAL